MQYKSLASPQGGKGDQLPLCRKCGHRRLRDKCSKDRCFLIIYSHLQLICVLNSLKSLIGTKIQYNMVTYKEQKGEICVHKHDSKRKTCASYSFWGGHAHKPHQGSASGPHWGTSVLQTPTLPLPNLCILVTPLLLTGGHRNQLICIKWRLTVTALLLPDVDDWHWKWTRRCSSCVQQSSISRLSTWLQYLRHCIMFHMHCNASDISSTLHNQFTEP